MALEERRFHPPAEALFLNAAELREALRAWPTLGLEELATLDSELAGGRAERVTTRLPFELRATKLLREEKGFAALAERIRGWTAAASRVALVVGNAAQAERLKHILEGQELLVPALGEPFPEARRARATSGALHRAGRALGIASSCRTTT